MSTSKSGAIKTKYTLKLLAAVAFLCFAVWLSYWLLFEYRVRNLLGLLLIVVFLVIPSIMSALTIPREVIGLIAIWRSHDPAAVERTLGDIREQDPM
jgi:fatty acid desaturase